MSLTVRAELSSRKEHLVISALATRAFRRNAMFPINAARIISGLRGSGDLTLSLVCCTRAGTIIGHAAFSKSTHDGEGGKWYFLGPLSVLPEYQGLGVGTSLITQGMRLLKTHGASGCITYGSNDFFKLTGFQPLRTAQVKGLDARFLLYTAFRSERPRGLGELSESFQHAYS